MQLFDVGDCAVLVELPGLDDVLALHAALRRAQGASDAAVAVAVEDLVPAARTVLVRFDPRRTTTDDVRAWVSARQREAEADGARAGAGADELIQLPVRYDGADLEDVGRLTGLGADGVVAAHTATEWTVAFTGFAPGFGYLVGGDPRLEVPRLATPRVRVPAGSVALAGRYSGVYPQDSPGGWRLIATTRVAVWDLDRDPPGLLRPGVRIRFVPGGPP